MDRRSYGTSFDRFMGHGRPPFPMPPEPDTKTSELPTNGNGRSRRRKNRDNDSIVRVAPRATFFDPMLAFIGTGPGAQKQGLLGYRDVRAMFDQCSPLGAIRNTRLNQIAAHALRNREEDDQRPGWKVCLKDDEKEPSDDDKARIRKVEDFFDNMCAVPEDADLRKKLRPGIDYPEYDFAGFITAIMRDSFEIDALCFEKVRKVDGSLFTLWPVDGATINRFLPRKKFPGDDPRTLDAGEAQELLGDAVRWMDDRGDAETEAAFCQVIDGTPRAYFGHEDLCYRYRNVRTDVRFAGFGYAEAEQLVSVITGILNAERFNLSNFSNGHIPEGILQLVGSYDKGDLDSMKRDWQASGQGVINANRLAIIASRDAKAAASWIALRSSNRDMEYPSWLDFLVRVTCAVCNIAPEEINFQGYGQTGGLFEKGPEAEIKHSKDKGLVPILHGLAKIMTGVVQEMEDDLEFRFTGLDADDEDAKEERMVKRLGAGYSTVNMERAIRDDDPIPAEEKWGDAPLNPIANQIWQGEQQAKQQEQMAGEPPAEGSPDRMNFFRAPQKPGEDPDQQPGDEQPPGDEQKPPGQDNISASQQFARSFALAGWKEE